MTAPGIVFSRRLQEACDAFRQASDKDDLWRTLHRHLAGFGITGLQYGVIGMGQGIAAHSMVLDSLSPGFLDAKLRDGGLENDMFLQTALSRGAPLLWDDRSFLAADVPVLSPKARRSLDIDWSFGITTGVTLPMRFAGGLGVSAMGCHAAGLSWDEFDRVWQEHGGAVVGISSAFDTALRRDHIGQFFPLTAEERECLLWLAAGLQHKQIADRLRLTDRQVGKRFETARAKLKAVTTLQAMANALIFGLIDP